MQPGDDAIPEAKVAFRGLLRRKRLAMTSEVAKLLAMANKVTSFFAMTEGARNDERYSYHSKTK